MDFVTKGPFEITELSKAGIDKFFEDIRADDESLQHGIGVYIVSVPKSKNKLIPYYVGLTENEFGSRLIQHFRANTFGEIFQLAGRLSVFLIARSTPSGRVKKATPAMRKAGGLRSIKELEFSLIGSCLEKNPDLLNKQEKTFHKTIRVPGYWNWNSAKDGHDKSAEKLAMMLGTKKKS